MGRALTRSLGYLCLMLVVLALPVHGGPAAATVDETSPRSIVTTYSPEQIVLRSSSTGRGGLARAGMDSFYLFGGPGTEEGRFQEGPIPDHQGWIGVDRTDLPVVWQVSDFNAATLGGHGSGNLAAWCGRELDLGTEQVMGYGNDWEEWMLFESSPLADPSVAQTVSLDFFFNLDTEPGADYFEVAYDSAGTWVTVYRISGANREAGDVFPAPGLRYSDMGADPIVYAGDDYGGDAGDQIVLRLRFVSDDAVSNEDGLGSAVAGAVQVDDISVVWSESSSFDDFEGGFTGSGFIPVLLPFAGDFVRYRPRFFEGDLDPCAENTTPVASFVNAGQGINNVFCSVDCCTPPYCFPDGVTSPSWNYGFAGGWVVDYTDGVSSHPGFDVGDPIALRNEIWSPEIDWDLAGSEDDGADFVGAELRYTMWDHLIPENGITAVWHVRSSVDGEHWSPWRDPDVFYVGDGTPRWERRRHDLGDLLLPSPVKIQVALGVWDMARAWGLAGDDATPAPVFDDVSVVKYRVDGPTITALRSHLAQSGFPPAGHVDVSTTASRDELDIPFDMARDIGGAMGVIPGDSVVAKVASTVDGSSVDDVRMLWVLEKNPLFEDALRAVPSRDVDENVVTGPDRWSGEVVGRSVTDAEGQLVPDRWFFDLPDTDFLYPGDALRYHFRATDDAVRVSTLPADLTGFDDGQFYDASFAIRGLPVFREDGQGHPTKLVVDLAERLDRRRPLPEYTFAELGFVKGIHYDVFPVPLAADALSNGIGSAGGHGATAAQLEGYDTILVLGGAESGILLSDGSEVGGNDRSDDLGVLDKWRQLPGIRNVLYMGDSLVSGLVAGGSGGAAYVETAMAVDPLGHDVRTAIGGESTPLVKPALSSFATTIALYGACPHPRRFDHIVALPAASVGHDFADRGGNVYPGPAASVIHDRFVEGHRKVDLTLPFGLPVTQHEMLKADVNTTVRTELLREIFDYFGVTSGGKTVVDAPAARAIEMEVYPNPFNPRTTVRFTGLPPRAEGAVRVLNLRGEQVATLHDGVFESAELVWEGVDDAGQPVASGVYLIEARAAGFEEVRKVAVLK